MQVVLKTCVSACFLWGLGGKIGGNFAKSV